MTVDRKYRADAASAEAARQTLLSQVTAPVAYQPALSSAMVLQQINDETAFLTWDDLRFPANGIDPAGSTAPASRDTTTGMLTFSGTSNNIIAGIGQLPHAWKPGTTLRPHVHLAFPNANAGKNTRWLFEYNRGNANEDFEHPLGTYSSLPAITVANPDATAKQVLASFGDLTMEGYRESCCILWRISRLATDGADDDTGAATLLEFDIHYQTDKHGTVTEIPT